MHEYSIAQALIDRVAEEARLHAALKVRSLWVHVGQLSGVEPALLASAYDLCRAGTVCDEAELTLVGVPAVWSCPTCEETIASGEVLRCPRCGGPARLLHGGELLLERIEMEVTDV